MSEVYDVLIVGSGAVGSAVAREFTLLGQQCIVCEKNPDVIGEASSGNTGHLARNFHYTLNRAPLEFKLTRDAAVNHNPYWLESQPNVPRRKTGLIMVAFTKEEVDTLLDMESKAVANGEDVRIIGCRELKVLEPNLATVDKVLAALYSPEEYVVDPYLLPLSNLYVALSHGCKLVTRCLVTSAVQRPSDNYWLVNVENRGLDGGKASTSTFVAKRVVNCAGNYSDDVDSWIPRAHGEPKPFTIRPGRGEYLVFESAAASQGVRGIVTQVPSKTYAGLYIFNSVYGNVAVGPTNITQDSKLDRGCNVESVKMLREHVLSQFPNLKDYQVVGTYSGLRPASPEFNDYQIRFSHENTWATLGAIRSTGLSASRAIAQYAAKNMFSDYDQINKKHDVVMPPALPQPDGSIKIGPFNFKPTHKLSQLGLTPQKSSL